MGLRRKYRLRSSRRLSSEDVHEGKAEGLSSIDRIGSVAQPFLVEKTFQKCRGDVSRAGCVHGVSIANIGARAGISAHPRTGSHYERI